MPEVLNMTFTYILVFNIKYSVTLMTVNEIQVRDSG